MEINRIERKVSPLERFLSFSPYSIVTVVARIKGTITEDMLKEAVHKAQQRHANLRVRMRWDEEHEPWFTSEDVKEIPVELVPRESDDHWIEVQHEEGKRPFEFDERPAIRFILIQSPDVSELMILCHHIICDGLSLAYLARDLMVYLGDPSKVVEILPDPVPIDLDNLPKGVSTNPVVKFFINRMNKGWRKERVHFDQEDYKNLNEAYWMNAEHRMLSIELSEPQTSSLVKQCREENTTVNSALTTAFVGAQQIVQDGKKGLSNVFIAGNLRDRLQKPAGEEMGFFAGAVTLDFSYDERKGFWDNARSLHQKVQPLYTTRTSSRTG